MPALTSEQVRPRLFLALVAGVGVLLAGTLGLWAYYGTAVFFELIRSGWVACF